MGRLAWFAALLVIGGSGGYTRGMEREPKIERGGASEPDPEVDPAFDPETAEDAELAAHLEALGIPPGLPVTDEEIAEADARAEADIAAGRVYPHSLVSVWLATWGDPDYKPFHEWLTSSGQTRR